MGTIIKHLKLWNGLKLAGFGFATIVATGTMTYFIAPSTSTSNSSNSISNNLNNDDNGTTHGDLLFANIAGISKLTLNDFNAEVKLPESYGSNHVGLDGSLSLSMPTLSNLALNVDSTLTYYDYADSSKASVQKDLDLTYLGEDKNLYLSLTDHSDKTATYNGDNRISGIRYAVEGTDYDDLIDTIVEVLSASRFSVYSSSSSTSSASSASSMASLMTKVKLEITEDDDQDYLYTFKIDLGKENFDPIVLRMSSDENCNLTGVWTDSPIRIPLNAANNEYCEISLTANDANMTSANVIEAPSDAASYSRLVNSTSLMKNVFRIVDKEAFSLGISGDLVHKYDEKEVVLEDKTVSKEDINEILHLSADFALDYPNNKFDLKPALLASIDDKKYEYALGLSLRQEEEANNLYFDYSANGVDVSKLNFTNVIAIDELLGSLKESFGGLTSNADMSKINSVVNYFTKITADTKELITGKSTLEGEGAPTNNNVKEGSTYTDLTNNDTYTFNSGTWVKDAITLLDEIKAGHYQGVFDLLKGVYTNDNIISVVISLEPFGLGDDSVITLTLDGNETSSNLLSVALSDLSFSDFTLSNLAIVANDLKEDYSFKTIDSSAYASVNNMPGLFDEFGTIANSKKAALSLSGSYSKEVGESAALSSLDFDGKIAFDANDYSPSAKVNLTLNQNYKNKESKNVVHSLKMEMGDSVINSDTVAKHDYLTKFAYQSKDVDELSSSTKGGLYGKGYISSISDLYTYLRGLLSDEKETLSNRIINPIRNLSTLIALSKTSEAVSNDESGTTYFDFLKTSYISGISNEVEDAYEIMTFSLNGKAFNLDSDIDIKMVRYANNGELESIRIDSLDLGDGKALSLTLKIHDYDSLSVSSCPEESESLKYYDFSSLATLAKFGLNTGLTQTSYYWKGSLSLSLGQLHGVLDVNMNIYLKVSGSSFKMLGDFELPLIPDVNGPTENLSSGLRELAGLGTRKVSFAYDAKTDYSSNTSDSKVYFHGVSDVKGSTFDTEDYASFDMIYLLNHADDVLLGYVLDLYPSLIKKESTEEDTSEVASSSKVEINLDNEYDSIIKDYSEPGYDKDGTWSLTLDAASLLGVMDVNSDSFDFSMDARHVGLITLSATSKDNLLSSLDLNLKVYLGINLQAAISLENVDVSKNDDTGKYYCEIADEKISGDSSEFAHFIENFSNYSINSVVSKQGKATEFTTTNSWILDKNA